MTDPIPHPAAGVVEVPITREHPLAKRLLKALTTAMDHAGTMPTKAAVKLRPADWHAVERVIRETAAALTPDPAKAGQADDVAGLRAAHLESEEQIADLWDKVGEWMDRATAVEARNKVLEEALRPFAKAGELFGPRKGESYDIAIYAPAAGQQYWLSGDDLRRARAVLFQHQKGDGHGSD